MSEHAILAPSAASRWMQCPGSVVLEADEPEVESPYAREGSIAHALAALCITENRQTAYYSSINYRGTQEPISKDMAVFIQGYLDRLMFASKSHLLMVEQKLELEPFTYEKNAYGTGDAVIIANSATALLVRDLKYGMGEKVFAKDNPQLMLYAVAALRQFDMLGDFKTVLVEIDQPRLDHFDSWSYEVEELTAFANKVRVAADVVELAKKSNSLAAYIKPSEDACRWCKARYKCPALATMVAEAALVDFEDATQKELPEVAMVVNLGSLMDKVAMVENWCKAVRGKVESELLSGKTVEGWKLVQGKKGNREWNDELKAEKKLRSLKFKNDTIFISNIITPSAVEKLLKKEPQKFEKFKDLIDQKPGKPSVAPLSDKREEYVVNHEKDFENLVKGEAA